MSLYAEADNEPLLWGVINWRTGSPLAMSAKRASRIIHKSQAVLMYHSDQSRIDPAGIEDARGATIAAGDHREAGE